MYGRQDSRFSSVMPLLLIPGVLEPQAAQMLAQAEPALAAAVSAAEAAQRAAEELENADEPPSQDGQERYGSP